MDTAPFVVMLILLFAVAGVVIYFGYDYYKYKKEVEGDFSLASQRIDTEKSDRLSNLKFVVDQVNDVNTQMFDSVSSNMQDINTVVNRVDASQSNLMTGLDMFFSIGNLEKVGSSNIGKTSILNLPGMVNPNINLLQKVTATMGLTAKDLSKDGNRVRLCSKDDPERCIEFPDENGDTVLKSLDKFGGVVVDSDMRVNGSLSMFSDGLSDRPSAWLNAMSDGLMVTSDKFAIRSMSSPNFMPSLTSPTGTPTIVPSFPSAQLHVQGSGEGSILKVSTSTNTPVEVDKDGNVLISSPLIVKNENGVGSKIMASVDGKSLRIEAPTGGAVEVAGTLKVTGDIEVNGQKVQTAAPTTSTTSTA